MKDEQLYSIALTRIPGLGLIGIHKLVDALGSATAVFLKRSVVPKKSFFLPKRTASVV